MTNRFLIILLLIAFSCCKTGQKGRLGASAPAGAQSQTEAQGGVSAATPMSCRITGKIISIIKTYDDDTASVCSRYHCRAMVNIINISDCGSSVPVPLDETGTIEVRFAFTLSATSKVFKDMKAQYPGLKKGDVFTANAEHRLRLGQKPEYVVYGYEVQPSK